MAEPDAPADPDAPAEPLAGVEELVEVLAPVLPLAPDWFEDAEPDVRSRVVTLPRIFTLVLGRETLVRVVVVSPETTTPGRLRRTTAMVLDGRFFTIFFFFFTTTAGSVDTIRALRRTTTSSLLVETPLRIVVRLVVREPLVTPIPTEARFRSPDAFELLSDVLVVAPALPEPCAD